MNRRYLNLFWQEEEVFVLPPRRQVRFLPAYAVREIGGYDRSLVSCTRELGGYYAVLGVAGWNVYVGADDVPDMASPTFTDTLPYQVATTPPVSGTKIYNVLLRKVNSYGLESQNQQSYSFTIDSTGTLVAPVKVAPSLLLATLATAGGIRVTAMWNAYSSAIPATWKLWVKATAPDVGVDAVTQTALATSPVLRPIITGTLVPSLWHVALGVYSEGVLSDVSRTTITVPEDLDSPILLP